MADLDAAGIRVHCLALGGVDLTSSSGKLTMHVINAVAEFKRDILIEFSGEEHQQALELLAAEASRWTIMRVRDRDREGG